MCRLASVLALLFLSAFALGNSSHPRRTDKQDANDADDLQLLQKRVQVDDQPSQTLMDIGEELSHLVAMALPSKTVVLPANLTPNSLQVTNTRTRKPKKKRKKKSRKTQKEEPGRSTILGGTHGEHRILFKILSSIVLLVYALTSIYLHFETVLPPQVCRTSSRGHLYEAKSRDREPVDEDTTGFLIFSIIDDGHVLVRWDGPVTQRASRILKAVGLFLLTNLFAVSILLYIQQYCVAELVWQIRTVYSRYELDMVGGHSNFTTITEYGEHRAMAEHFDPAFFNYIGAGRKEKVCHIPFSQPFILKLAIVLLTFTCCSDYRRSLDYYFSLIIMTPTIDSMADAVRIDEDGKKVLAGIPCVFKHAIYWVILVPRVFVTLWLMWLGCRWLSATNDFGDLILNSLALEFILSLPQLFYNVMVSSHCKLDIQNTEILTPATRQETSLSSHLLSLMWGGFSFAWTVYYINHFQTVLPGYRFDVAGLCNQWIRDKYGF